LSPDLGTAGDVHPGSGVAEGRLDDGFRTARSHGRGALVCTPKRSASPPELGSSDGEGMSKVAARRG